MHRCGSSSRASAYAHGAGGVIPCSCNDYQRMGSCGGGTSAFAILFDMPNKTSTEEETLTDPYTYYSSSSSSCSSPVDCTLSLGTASTRQRSAPKSPQRTTAANNSSSSSSCMPATFYWDILSQSSKMPASSKCGASVGANSDPLVARRCANCDTTSTPLWRNGPRGPKSLCNACGIRYKKEERRAAATAACPAAVAEPQRHVMSYTYQQDHPWAYAPSPQGSAARKSQSISRWSDEAEGGDDSAALPYLSWCLNVPTHPHRAEFLRH